MNGLSSVNLRERFITRSEISNYSKRNQFDLDIPRKNQEYSRRYYFHTGAEIWNNTPMQIREIVQHLNKFKRKFAEFLQKES